MGNSNKKYGFGKDEKLKSRKLIEELFTSKDHYFSYPIKAILLKKETLDPGLPKVLVVASKRSFKKAVDRNRIKRLLREAYRLNAVGFKAKASNKCSVNIAFIYVGKNIESFQKVEGAMKAILGKIDKNLD